jgi:hypothetical protein
MPERFHSVPVARLCSSFAAGCLMAVLAVIVVAA